MPVTISIRRDNYSRRRSITGPTDVTTSMRFGGLVINTVVCLTLAKWETVSGQFGGYLSDLKMRLLSRPREEITLGTNSQMNSRIAV